MARIGTSDLHAAINERWDDADLDDRFKDLWDSIPDTDNDEFLALNDQEAAPGTPMPYCVYRIDPGTTTTRMSDDAEGIREIRDVPVEFTVHARVLTGDSRSAKAIASDLIADVIEGFGGHPTEAPPEPVLSNGKCLIMQFQNDYGERTGENEYSWRVNYIARLDVPVQTIAT